MNTPLYEEIYDVIRSEISTGKLPPGSPLPSEKALGQRFGVSRITTGRALKQLVAEGLIVRRPGKGSFVKEGGGDVSPDKYRASDRSTLLQDVEGLMPFPSVQAEAGKIAREPQSSVSIGFVIPDWGDSYGLQILSGVERAANSRQACLFVNRSYGIQEIEEDVISRMIDHGVQGLIVYPVNGEFYNPKILRLHVDNFPLLFIDRYIPKLSIPYVATDNQPAAYELTNYLIQLGHRRIAYFSPPKEDTTPLLERFLGYTSALREADFPIDPELIVLEFPTSISLERDQVYNPSTALLIRSFFEDHPEVTAVAVMEHHLAVHTMQVCREMGKTVPHDLSIVCFDGPSRNGTWPAITHMRQQEHVMGQQVIDMLIRRIIDGDISEISSVVLPAELIIGDTSAPPRKL